MSPRLNQDTPWKQLIKGYFQECLTFFMPPLSEAIDWAQPPVFLDKELSQLTRDNETGKKIVDELAKVILKNGQERCVLFAHLEIQGGWEKEFAERLFIYRGRIFDKHRSPIATLAILTDDNRHWRPNRYEEEVFGSTLFFEFPVIKLLDYEDKKEALLADSNPFAVVVLAHLALIESRRGKEGDERKYVQKTALTRHLYRLAKQKGESRDFVRDLYRFLDFVLVLPPEIELKYDRDVHLIEEEFKMSYVTSIERRAKDAGLQQGLEKGLVEGLEKGLVEGLEKGRQEESERVALALLRAHVDEALILKATELDKERLSQLKGDSHLNCVNSRKSSLLINRGKNHIFTSLKSN